MKVDELNKGVRVYREKQMVNKRALGDPRSYRSKLARVQGTQNEIDRNKQINEQIILYIMNK